MVKKTRGTKRRRRSTHKAAKKQRGGGKELDSSIKQQEQPYAHEQVMELTKQWRENLSACQKDNDELKARVIELEAKNDVLKAKVTELKAGNNALKAKVTELEANVAAVLPPPWSPAWIKLLNDAIGPRVVGADRKRVNALVSRLENGEQFNIFPLGMVYLGPPKMDRLADGRHRDFATGTTLQKPIDPRVFGPLGPVGGRGGGKIYRVEDNKLVGEVFYDHTLQDMSIRWWKPNPHPGHKGKLHNGEEVGNWV